MWNTELDNLKSLYLEYREDRERVGEDSNAKKKKVVSKPGKKILVEC